MVLEIFFFVTKQPVTDFYLFGESGDGEARKGQGCGGHLFNKELLQQQRPKFFIPDKGKAGQRIPGVGKSQQCEARASKGDSSPSGCSGFMSAL